MHSNRRNLSSVGLHSRCLLRIPGAWPLALKASTPRGSRTGLPSGPLVADASGGWRVVQSSQQAVLVALHVGGVQLVYIQAGQRVDLQVVRTALVAAAAALVPSILILGGILVYL